jgi:hypothetical protein
LKKNIVFGNTIDSRRAIRTSNVDVGNKNNNVEDDVSDDDNSSVNSNIPE